MGKVTVNFSVPMKALASAGAAISGDALRGAAFDDMRKQWLSKYITYVKRRFIANSSGAGGDWAPLALSTVKARRRGKGKDARRANRGNARTVVRNTRSTGVNAGGLETIAGKVSTLRDTNMMFRALDIGGAGNVTAKLPFGVAYGFSNVTHSPRAKGKPITLARLVSIHDAGNSRLPRRRILWEPNERLMKSMIVDLTRAMLASLPGLEVTGGGAGTGGGAA